MRTVDELPQIPWVGRLSPPTISDARYARLVDALAGRTPRAADAPRRAMPAILGLASTVISVLLLHEPAGVGSLRADPEFGGGARNSSSSGVPEMKRMQSLMAGVLGVGVVAGGAGAQFNAEFTAWGNNEFGQLAIPSATPLTQVALGNLHSLGLTAQGSVVAWGTNASGQCDVPLGVTDAVQIAAGGWYAAGVWYGTYDERGHSVALLRDGTIRAWGSNEYGQCDVPTSLGSVVQIACGWAHTAALRLDGSVVVWGAGLNSGGDPHWGQRLVPSDLDPVSKISTKGCHIMARLGDGAVRCWGRNTEAQCHVPAKLGPVTDIAAGSDHSVVLLPSGQVRCWGFNQFGQSVVPNNLGPARAIAASMYGTLALLQDGSIRTWGLIDPPPTTLTDSETLVVGGYHAVAMAPRDCNANGIRDALELATARDFDTDGDGLLDSCDQPDLLPVLRDILVTRGISGPFPWPICGAWDTRTEVGGSHLHDLWASRESVNGPWMNRADVPAGNLFRLEMALQDGVTALNFRFNSSYCADGFFSVNLWLDSNQQPSISATNGTPVAPFSGQIPGLVPGPSVQAAGVLAARIGARQIRVTGFSVSPSDDAVGAVTFKSDGSNDLVATLTILVSPACGGDVSGNGIVDGVDLAAVLGAWGTDGHGQFDCDIDRDGSVNGSDLAQVLGNWGACP